MNTDTVTLVMSRGSPVNKQFTLHAAGSVTKKMAPNNGFFAAQTKSAANLDEMVGHLHALAADPSLTLSLGVFKDAPDGVFLVEPCKALARRLNVDPADKDAWAGFHEIDGKWYVARAKVNMAFSSWILLDRDTVPEMPPELVALDRDRWLAAMARLLPGLDTAGHIIVPSSSSRVCLNGVPRESSSWHLFTQVSDPAELDRVWRQVLVKAFSVPLDPDAPPWEDDPVTLGFLRPKYSRKEPDVVVAWQPWSIYDPSTCSPERLVFDGQPTVRGEGLTLAPPQILVHEGARLDLSAFEDITEDAAKELEKRSSVTVEFEYGGKGKVKVVSVKTISKTLSLDLEIETKEGWTTVGELHARGAGHTRCQSPFRESESWAAYYGVHTDGSPFIFDSGSHTKYVLPGSKSYGDALFDLSHDGLALDMGRKWQPVSRYVALWERWLFYDSTRWERDDSKLYMTRTRDYLRQRADNLVKAAHEGEIEGLDEKGAEALAKTLRSVGMVRSVSELATSNKELVAKVEQWDQNAYLLGTPTGYVDLCTGKLQAATPDHYITKLTAVAPAPPGTPAPLWEAFLERIFRHDPELVPFVQRSLGYSLLGTVSYHVLLFCWGQGGKGKGVLLNTVSKILADYARVAPADMLLSSQSERHPCDMAMLRGARFVTAQEIAPGKSWDEPKLKSLTGGDEITARFMRQDFFTYTPQFTLWCAGNHKPNFRTTDETIRRRVQLVPFLQVIPTSERDPDLPRKLEAEWPAILRWMVDGCLAFQRKGLNPPASALAATEAYLESEDILGQWLNERCVVDPREGWRPLTALYLDWQNWTTPRGHYAGSSKALSKMLDERGLHRRKTMYGQGFDGIKLLPVVAAAAAAAAGHDEHDDHDDGSIRAEFPVGPQQGTTSHAYGFNGRDRHDRHERHVGEANAHGLTCAHCQKPILPDSSFTAANSGEHLHNACVTPWCAANPEEQRT